MDREQLGRLVDLSEEVVDIVEEGFRQLGVGRVTTPTPLRMGLPGRNAELDVKTAYVEGWDSFAVKVSTGFFDNPQMGLASGGGFMVLLESSTGKVSGVLLDDGYLTAVRTAAAGAVAARWLSSPHTRTVGVLGAGEQARWQARAITLVRQPEQILVHSRRPERAEVLAQELADGLGLRVRAVESVEELVRVSDTVVTCTPSRQPLVRAEWLHPGLHITAVGSDAPEKQELEAEVLARADLVACDLRQQSLLIGEGRTPAAAGVLAGGQLVELGGIVARSVAGRRCDADVTVCDLTGVGVSDTAIARLALSRAGQTTTAVPSRRETRSAGSDRFI